MTDQCRIFNGGLCNEQPVKRISMEIRQVIHFMRMFKRDGQMLKRLFAKSVKPVFRKVQFAETFFNSNLPDGDRADHYRIAGVFDHCFRVIGQLRHIGESPEQYVCIEQQFHLSIIPSDAAMSDGNSSKSAAISILPFNLPGRRGL